MADNVNVTPGTGASIAADEVVDGTLGTVKVQYVKLMDGTLDGTTKAGVGVNGLKVDGSAVTQPVSAAALPLPSGASTSAKQPALGTAGTPSTDVITVQGVTSMTALKVDGSAVTQPVSLTSTTVTGTVAVTESGTWTVQPGNTANTTPWLIAQATTTPVLKNGLTNAASAVVSSTAATLSSYYVYNPNSSVAYIQLFDVATAGAVTLGTTVPKWSIGIPATSGANLSNVNLSFANGIQVAATTTATGLTAPSTALDANFSYR